jgi:hypothetical protein
MSQDEQDNVYIDLLIVKQIVDDLYEMNRKVLPTQCQCGSKKFTTDGEKFTCSNCGEPFDPTQESPES